MDEATLVVSIEKKSFSNLFVGRFTFIEETSGTFLLLLHEINMMAASDGINSLLIPQIKAKNKDNFVK
jgi:hypothetical protein